MRRMGYDRAGRVPASSSRAACAPRKAPLRVPGLRSVGCALVIAGPLIDVHRIHAIGEWPRRCAAPLFAVGRPRTEGLVGTGIARRAIAGDQNSGIVSPALVKGKHFLTPV